MGTSGQTSKLRTPLAHHSHTDLQGSPPPPQHGEGNLASRERGQIINRGPGKWLLRIYVGRGADGKPKYSAKTVRGTTAEARKRLTQMLSAVDTQTFVE